ncbi:MAG: CD225/dispanin family protein, partial [Planctomycetota bacterium]
AGIVFAAQVDSKWNSGDTVGAQSAADNAKKFTLIGLVLGLVINALVIGLQILAGLGAAAQQGGGF